VACRLGHVVVVPAAVAVGAVQAPVMVVGVVAELGDGLAGPARAGVGMPGWAALVDGDALAPDAVFGAVLGGILSSQ
jgi:hypothetical protein